MAAHGGDDERFAAKFFDLYDYLFHDLFKVLDAPAAYRHGDLRAWLDFPGNFFFRNLLFYLRLDIVKPRPGKTLPDFVHCRKRVIQLFFK
ncbi:hypothetical protein SDC9_139609 [bioreactor metagenome]|uniref:Uncharacterized protein n=1 Tax=bioreactor metagenome TaxID=1076179 RepID=A0A645DSL3_9ZZZZ